jgi:hypothetical protein
MSGFIKRLARSDTVRIDEAHDQLQVMETDSYVYSFRESNTNIYFFTLALHGHKH